MQSLEAELKFVHQVSLTTLSSFRQSAYSQQKVNERDEELRERETYIKQLETTLQDKHLPFSLKSSSQSLFLPQSIPLPPSPTTPTVFITTAELPAVTLPPVQEADTPVDTPVEEDGRLSALSRSLSKLEDGPVTETQMRVDDLMR